MPSLPPWHDEPITKAHDRDSFDCGVPALNKYLRKHARQNHDRAYVRTFVAVSDEEAVRVLGYYSLCNAHVEFQSLPEHVVKGLPRYPVPAVRLARLACDVTCQGGGLGSELLLRACERAIAASENSGAAMLVIDAKDERAASWYESRDAARLLDAPNTLVISLDTVRRELAEALSKQTTES